MITGQQIRAARTSLGWEPKALAIRAKVPLSVVLRAEGSPGEPLVTIAQLNALMQALRAAGASFPPADPPTDGDNGQP
ncbi:helix-turn-helix domain-containing protein [Methylobacterium phyllosphaerae]